MLKRRPRSPSVQLAAERLARKLSENKSSVGRPNILASTLPKLGNSNTPSEVWSAVNVKRFKEKPARGGCRVFQKADLLAPLNILGILALTSTRSIRSMRCWTTARISASWRSKAGIGPTGGSGVSKGTKGGNYSSSPASSRSWSISSDASAFVISLFVGSGLCTCSATLRSENGSVRSNKLLAARTR